MAGFPFQMAMAMADFNKWGCDPTYHTKWDDPYMIQTATCRHAPSRELPWCQKKVRKFSKIFGAKN